MRKYIIPDDIWLRFGCFLSGYNYQLLSESSEASKKYIKKITSALIIIITIWSMVGYLFAIRYAGASEFVAILASILAGIIIIQIERQIILGGKIKAQTIVFRLLLGLIVAIIGALILDQIFFKNDIANKKEDLLEKRIEERVTNVKRNAEKNIDDAQINIDSLTKIIIENENIARKEGYKIQTSNTQTTQEVTAQNSLNTSLTPTKITTASKTYSTHPKLLENNGIRNKISTYESTQNTERDSLFVRIERAKVLARSEPPGFLNELTIIVELATQSGIALFAYVIFLLFFIFIELFIVLAKLNDGDNDYHRLILYQERIREERLKVLEEKRTAALGEDEKIDSSSIFINSRPR